VAWNVGSDSRLIVVFSLPEDMQLRSLERFTDVVDENGVLAPKFAVILKSFRSMIGESSEWMG
jgi:hypothetical protein